MSQQNITTNATAATQAEDKQWPHTIHCGHGKSPSTFRFGTILTEWCATKGIPTYEADRNYYNLPSHGNEIHREIHADPHPLITHSTIQAFLHAPRAEDVDALTDAFRAKKTVQLTVQGGQKYALIVDGNFCCCTYEPSPESEITRYRAFFARR